MGLQIAMSRDYQPLKNNPYLLPKPLYRMTLAFIRDHERKVSVYNRIGTESPAPSDGQPRGSGTGKPTERDGIRRAELREAIAAVESALQILPEEYRKGVWENITKYRRYPDDAEPRTYRTYKQRFIYHVARNMFWI